MSGKPEDRERFRFFISSPGDLRQERDLAQEVIEQRLQKDAFVRDQAECKAVRWDDPNQQVQMPATGTPQEAINLGLTRPRDCDVVIVMLWKRMGTPLSDKKADGTHYLSGTEWEYEDALNAKPRPLILVYRRTSKMEFDPDGPDEAVNQYQLVLKFFERFKGADGVFRGSFFSYKTPEDFGDRLLSDLKQFVKDRLESKKKVIVKENRLAKGSWSEVRRFGPPQTNDESLVPVPRDRLKKLKDLQSDLDVYISGYVTCRELSDVCQDIASGFDHGNVKNRIGDDYFWRGLCRDLAEARDKIGGLPDKFKQECADELSTFGTSLGRADELLGKARSSKQEPEYSEVVDSSRRVIDSMKNEMGSVVGRAKRKTDALLKDIGALIQAIQEWMPPEAAQDQVRPQDGYASKERRGELAEQKAAQKPADGGVALKEVVTR